MTKQFDVRSNGFPAHRRVGHWSQNSHRHYEVLKQCFAGFRATEECCYSTIRPATAEA